MRIARKRMLYTALVTLIVVFSGTFVVLMTLERNDYRNYLQSEYSKNMYELIDAVENIRTNLTKAAIVGSREQKIAVFEEIFRHSTVANDKLHSLPVSQPTIADTSKFLTQTGDFCYSLAKSSTEGNQLTDKDYGDIEQLKKNSVVLENQLKSVSDSINQGKVQWGEIRKKVTGVLAKGNNGSVSQQFEGIQKQVVQYPALIYDGPFSDNVLEITPKINSQKEISKSKAEETVRKLIGNNKIDNLEASDVNGKTDIKTYRFTAQLKGKTKGKDSIVCEVSKNGGKIFYLINNRSINNSSIDVNKAEDIGIKYLDKLGYHNMLSTYSLKYGNMVVVNYVYKQNGIIMYPDQVKLKIALDNGEIVGVEAKKYLVSHQDIRKLSNPKIGYKKAKERVGAKLNISNERLVVIPTDTNEEVLCYEFSGNYSGDDFKVYINAQTGYEERIIQIMNTPNGQLTI